MSSAHLREHARLLDSHLAAILLLATMADAIATQPVIISMTVVSMTLVSPALREVEEQVSF